MQEDGLHSQNEGRRSKSVWGSFPYKDKSMCKPIFYWLLFFWPVTFISETLFLARTIHFLKDCPLSVRTVHFPSNDRQFPDSVIELGNNQLYFSYLKACLFCNMIFLMCMIYFLFLYQVFRQLHIQCHIGRRNSHRLDDCFYKAVYILQVNPFYQGFEIVFKNFRAYLMLNYDILLMENHSFWYGK